MSDLKIRAKSELKLTDGVSNVTWGFPKGQDLIKVLCSVLEFSSINKERAKKEILRAIENNEVES